MPDNHRIAVLAGDGIGPEVMQQALRVLDAVDQPNFGVLYDTSHGHMVSVVGALVLAGAPAACADEAAEARIKAAIVFNITKFATWPVFGLALWALVLLMAPSAGASDGKTLYVETGCAKCHSLLAEGIEVMEDAGPLAGYLRSLGYQVTSNEHRLLVEAGTDDAFDIIRDGAVELGVGILRLGRTTVTLEDEFLRSAGGSE